MTNLDLAIKIVSHILSNLKGRKGVGNELEQIDDDVYGEMMTELTLLTEAILYDA